MYSDVFEVDDKVMGMDYLTPIGKAKVMREGKNFNYLYIKKKLNLNKLLGTDVTIVAFSKMVKYSLLAA
jgi:pyruvate/2-oxoglutarate/acetoin dehydrogenase E1 component